MSTNDPAMMKSAMAIQDAAKGLENAKNLRAQSPIARPKAPAKTPANKPFQFAGGLFSYR